MIKQTLLSIQRTVPNHLHKQLRSGIYFLHHQPHSQPTTPYPFHQSRTMTTQLAAHQLQALQKYTACDIADALLKLKVPNAGFLSDLQLMTKSDSISIAPASTAVFAPKSGADLPGFPESNIAAGKHWVDLTLPETIAILTQPEGQNCAVLGGIMALRMKVLNARGIVVCGRVRDVAELRDTGLPIWAKSTSIVGAGAESKPHALQVPLDIGGTIVRPGDLVFSDPTNGVVIIPQDLVAEVVSLLPKLVEADDRVKQDVSKGITVQEAFKRHRG